MDVKLAQAVYNRSPIWVQDLLLSAYGLKLYRARYAGIYRRHLAFLQQAENYSHSQLQELQARELRDLLTHAEQHVPWYREVFAEHGVQARQVDPDNLHLLPVLEKHQVQSNAERLVAEDLDRASLHTINTSGTTGSPLNIISTDAALQKNYAFFERFLQNAGVSSKNRSVTFAGRMLLPPEQSRPPYWRHNLAMRTLLCSSYHISPETADDYLQKIALYKPTFIDSYPSAIHTLSQHLLERRGRFDIRLKAIVTSSETLLEHQRATIEEAFDCRVYDQYGSAEMAACITQCEYGSYHVNPEYGIVEILRDDGTPAAPGETGELVCTGFLNKAMPMIRYRIGDSAVTAGNPCRCGRPWPVLATLLGRIDDLIIATDGRQIGRLDPLFKGLSGIKETQIVQVAPDRLVVNIVRADDYTSSVGTALVRALQMRVGRDMHVELRFLDRIPRTASGKFRAVVSELRTTERRANASRDTAIGS